MLGELGVRVVRPCRRAVAVLLLRPTGGDAVDSAPVELVGVAAILVGRGEGDVALVPTVELTALGELQQQLVVLQQHAPFPGPHQLPCLVVVVHGDPVVEVPEQHHAAACKYTIRSSTTVFGCCCR